MCLREAGHRGAESPATRDSNIPLGPQDAFTPTGGLLSATNLPLFSTWFLRTS